MDQVKIKPLKLYCYFCDKEIEAGDGERVLTYDSKLKMEQSKLVHKKCAKEYYKWQRETYQDLMK